MDIMSRFRKKKDAEPTGQTIRKYPAFKEKAAFPRSIHHSEKLDRLHRMRVDYACLPFNFTNEKWVEHRIAGTTRFMKENKDLQHKRMIREINEDIKGIEFPIEEMAMVIRSWMREE